MIKEVSPFYKDAFGNFPLQHKNMKNKQTKMNLKTLKFLFYYLILEKLEKIQT